MLILTPTEFNLAAPGPDAVLDWVRSPDGQLLGDHGSCTAALLPADEERVLVLPPRRVSWHRVACPKVGAARLRAALDGLLEERLLADTSGLHVALEPGGKAGQTLWVAACDRHWLRSWLQALDAAGHPITRIVPGLSPLRGGEDTSPLHWAHQQDGRVWLASATVHGVAGMPLPDEHTVATPALGDTESEARWWSEPAVAADAERALDRRFELVALPAWLLRCAASPWNLAQFDLRLSSGARRGQRLSQSLRSLRNAPAWRPARWGLAALSLSLLVGLNAQAWQERRTLAAKQRAISQTLQNTFPEVKLVMDAPLQMQREFVRLQQASGTLAAGDLEAVLAAIAEALPDATPGAIEFTSGDARLRGWNVPEPQLQAIAQALNRRGWQAGLEGDTLRVVPKAP